MIQQENKTCAFCASPLSNDNRSKEHVIPQWLLDFLKIRKERVQPTHMSVVGEALSTRQHSLEGVLAGQVCEACNNGWMSELEQAVVPILKPLILGASVVVELNDSERQILSRWAAKTAFALNLSSNYVKNVPSMHFEHIRLNAVGLPANVSCFGQQQHGNRPFYWIQAPSWMIYGITDETSEIVEEIKRRSYKVSLQFGRLMLLVAYLPCENMCPVLWKGIHIPLLPKAGRCGYYEDEEYSWFNSEKALNEFHYGLHATLIK